MRLKNVIKVLTETEFIGLIGVTSLTGALGPGSTTHTSPQNKDIALSGALSILCAVTLADGERWETQ